MSNPEPCNCDDSVRLALELAVANDKLKRIATLTATCPGMARDGQDPREYAIECIEQIDEVLAEGPGERP